MWGIRGDEERKHDRRLAAGVAVLGQPCSQFGILRRQFLHACCQGAVHRHQLGILCFQDRDFLVKRHAPMLFLHRKSVCIDPYGGAILRVINSAQEPTLHRRRYRFPHPAAAGWGEGE